MFEKITLLQMAKAKMDWLAQRQEVLAENVANSDTPHYLPRDLKPLSFKEVLAGSNSTRVQATATNAAHVVPAIGRDMGKEVVLKKAYESSPDGNAVVLEEQMVKIGEARGAYEIAASLLQKQIRMIRMALNGRG